VLTDFGVSQSIEKAVEQDKERKFQLWGLNPTAYVGTPGYRCPNFLNQSLVRRELFAFGATVLEISGYPYRYAKSADEDYDNFGEIMTQIQIIADRNHVMEVLSAAVFTEGNVDYGMVNRVISKAFHL